MVSDVAAATAREYATLDSLQVRIETHRDHSEVFDDIDRSVRGALELSGTEDLVDVGCGTGSFLLGLAAGRHAGRIAGVDISPAAVAAVAGGGIAAVCGSALALPLADHAVDVVTARHMLYHVPDPATAIREFHRVLRPGGRLLVTVNHAEPMPRIRELIAEEITRWCGPPAVRHLSDVHSGTIDGLLADRFPSTRTIRRDNALVFTTPEPLIRFARALYGLGGLPPGAPERDAVDAAVTARLSTWFQRNAGPWRDPKGYVISVATR